MTSQPSGGGVCSIPEVGGLFMPFGCVRQLEDGRLHIDLSFSIDSLFPSRLVQDQIGVDVLCKRTFEINRFA